MDEFDKQSARMAFLSTRTETSEEEFTRLYIAGMKDARVDVDYTSDDPYAMGYINEVVRNERLSRNDDD